MGRSVHPPWRSFLKASLPYGVPHYICPLAEGNWVLPDQYPLASVSTDKVWQSLLLGTPAFVAGHINLAVTQAKKIDKKPMPSY